MSLISILRSSFSTRPLLSSPCCSIPILPGAKLFGGKFAAVPTITQHSTRSVWSEVIRQIPSDDPNKVGKLTFEDPDLADARMLRALRAEGMLLSRILGGGDEVFICYFSGGFFFLNFVAQINIHSNALSLSCAFPQHLYEEEPTLSDTRRNG